MNRKFKNALKNAYSIPEPQRKNEFLQDLTENNEKSSPFFFPLLKYGAVPVTAAIAVIVYTGFMHTNNLNEQYIENAPDIYDAPSQNYILDESFCNEDEAEDIHTHSNETEDIAASSFMAAVTVTSCSDASVNFCDSTLLTKLSLHENQSPSVTEVISSKATTTAESISSASTAVRTTTDQTRTTVSVTTRTSTVQTALTKPVTKPAVTKTTTALVFTDPAPQTTSKIMQSNNCEPVYTTTSNIAYEPPSDVGIDYTVYPDISFDITENIIEISEYIQFEYTPPNEDYVDSLLEPWKYDALRSDEVICGIVENQYLTVIDAVPYVQLDIMVNYPVKFGELADCDRISVYVPGEYMPLEIFIEKYNCYDTFKHLTETEISESTAYFPWTDVMDYYSGMELLFFIKKDEESLPENTYKLSSDSIYSLYSPNEDEFFWIDDESVHFTINEFHEFMGY